MLLAMTFWDSLTPEEYRVMLNAVEEGYLNMVIGDFLGHSEQGGAIWMSSNDTDAIRQLIPRFTAVVLDMIEHDLVEIREPADGEWDNAPAMTQPEIQAALGDPDTWIWSAGGDNRIVMLMTTDHADALMGRKQVPGE